MAQLTILMPAYNAASFIKEAVDSLLNQTFTNFELWIADDGSTDSTKEIIASFADLRIKKISNSENRGRVIVCNEIVKQITSGFFTITDADDVSHPTRLQKQMDLLISKPELMMCGTSFIAMDEKGYKFLELSLPTEQKEIYDQMPNRSQFLGPTTIMRSSVLKYFPELYRLYFKDNIADADLASRIVDQFQTTNVLEPLYYYRIVSSSLSRKNTSIRFLNLYKLISFLSNERRTTGKDSLELNKPEVVDQFLLKLSKPYWQDNSLLYRQTAFTHLYWNKTKLAWRSSIAAWCGNPLHWKNYFLLGYVITKGSYYLLLYLVGREHYSEIKNQLFNRNKNC